MINTPLQTLAQLRQNLPITREYIYLQTGSYAPVPEATQQVMAEALRLENERIIALGGQGEAADFYQRVEAARHKLATFLGASAHEIAWCDNTTTATRLAVCSFGWRAGDKLAVSDVEHLSTFALARGLQQAGVELTVIPTDDSGPFRPETFLEQLDRQLTPAHRLLILCHVANTDGRRLPVAEAVRMARARGVKTLIDGAQAVGVFPVGVDTLGADFYSGSLHKWLMGPAGVGFLVVRYAQLPAYNPYFAPQDDQPLTAAARSEMGTPNHVLRLGAGYAVDIIEGVGLPAIEQQMRTLTERLRTGLHEIPGLRNAGPEDWTLSSSITTLQLDGGTPERCQRLVARLRAEHRIVTKFRPEVCGVRLSVAAFNTADEIDRTLAALATLVPLI